MNLPHLLPIKFVTKVLEHKENHAKVACTFPKYPTLPMLIEASAQATSALSKSDVPMMGFLVLVKDACLLQSTQKLDLIVVVEKRLSLGNSCEFSFEVFETEDLSLKVASGILMIVLEG